MDMIAVIGAGQNSGKTTAVEALVREFKKRGLRVGTIKQIHEHNFSMDKRGKDSWRHAQAGAEIVVAASPNEVVAIKKMDGNNRFEESLTLLSGQDLDLLVIEGHPGVRVPMIYAARDEKTSGLKQIDENVFCIVSMSPEKFSKGKLPVFHMIDDVEGISNLILEKLS
jgi:molybdopterin-guanine dinucleotide biosynthesis protein B